MCYALGFGVESNPKTNPEPDVNVRKHLQFSTEQHSWRENQPSHALNNSVFCSVHPRFLHPILVAFVAAIVVVLAVVVESSFSPCIHESIFPFGHPFVHSSVRSFVYCSLVHLFISRSSLTCSRLDGGIQRAAPKFDKTPVFKSQNSSFFGKKSQNSRFFLGDFGPF